MEYICQSLFRNIDEKMINRVSNNRVKVIYKALFNNIFVIESLNKSYIEELNLFFKISSSRRFKLAGSIRNEVEFQPQVPRDLLRRTQNLGWSVNIGIIDSGVKKKSGIKLFDSIDFTGYNDTIVVDHGTEVAKIVKYYASGSNITSIKVSHDGYDISEALLIQALDFAAEKKLDIVNLSLELQPFKDRKNSYSQEECNGDCFLCDYVNTIVDEGIIVVSVAGNDGESEGNTITCPGRADKAITVGSINVEGKVSNSSGKGVLTFLKPNILAPGNVRILIDSFYRNVSGTSYSAPIITGILAALIPTQDIEKVITEMYKTCTDIGFEKYEQGFGLLNIEKLVEVLKDEETVSNSS
ncbi:S8 family serine peptidase [Exiguobacterium sp. KKBO11]|uniref:S8 family peptidase n=1 Tax=Exiguobacterium sp. KKBO11 TaxID=1805000 RepID=UPI0009EF5F93|nr:S8 family serine peptidase [Exiguobacterium sp. KKBO11]